MNEQLAQYIRQCVAQGVPEDVIRERLRQQGWDNATVETTYAAVSPPLTTAQLAARRNRTRNGILWILSPFIVLVAAVILSFILQALGLESMVTNILVAVMGIVGGCLFLVGPIVGIVLLVKKL